MSKKEPWKDFDLSEDEWNSLTPGEQNRMQQDLKKGIYKSPDQELKDYKTRMAKVREDEVKQLEEDEKKAQAKREKEVLK